MNTSPRTAYWATIELYRTYLFEDGPFLERIADEEGKMSADTLARIAHSYSVSRTIPASPDDGKSNLQLFAESVATLAEKWPIQFQDRAEACRDTAEKLAQVFQRKPPMDGKRQTTPRAPHSAVTKLIWFLKPDGWTVFDHLAANAVVPALPSARCRQDRFYRAIEEPLTRWAEELRPVVAKLGSRHLHPERLLDKFLVLRGLDETGRVSAETRNDHFLRLLPSEWASTLSGVAEEVARILPEDAFPRQSRSRTANKATA